MNAPTSISGNLSLCLKSFQTLRSTIPLHPNLAHAPLLSAKISEELARFKVWAGSRDASLDFQLRDAEHLRHEVTRLLHELNTSLADAISIMTGVQEPWDASSEGFVDDNGSKEVIGADDVPYEGEMDQISADIVDIIDCLFRLSPSIDHPAPHDLITMPQQGVVLDETFCVNRIKDRYKGIDGEIATRLGAACCLRARYTRSRKTLQGTRVRSYSSDALGTHHDWENDKKYESAPASATGRPMQTWLQDFTPKIQKEVALECPFCFTEISVRNEAQFEAHVFADIAPYVCLWKNCPVGDRRYGTQVRWMEHVMDDHWRQWRCIFCSREGVGSEADLKDHLRDDHQFGPDALEKVVERPNDGQKPFSAPINCPLCDAVLVSARQYQSHVGEHLEEIALLDPGVKREDHAAGEDDIMLDIDPGSLLEPDDGDDDSSDGWEAMVPVTRRQGRQLESSSSEPPAPWSAQDDELLLALRSNNVGWAVICNQFFPGRAWEDCQRRHAELSQRRGGD